MKKIMGFGDSFIQGIVKATSDSPDEPWYKAYQGMIGDHFNCYPEFRGVPGTGPWSMFFDFLNFQDKENVEVAIIAWSEINRLYHPVYQPINRHLVDDKDYAHKLSYEEKEVITAANYYYKELYDGHQKSYEMKALMALFDNMALEYKDIKFIHLPCFSWETPTEWWGETYKKKKISDLRYYHDFKNGMEIRPALMYLSMNDGWPDDLSNDPRECHLTPRVNRLLADSIIYCIENYQPGKLIEMDVSFIK